MNEISGPVEGADATSAGDRQKTARCDRGGLHLRDPMRLDPRRDTWTIETAGTESAEGRMTRS